MNPDRGERQPVTTWPHGRQSRPPLNLKRVRYFDILGGGGGGGGFFFRKRIGIENQGQNNPTLRDEKKYPGPEKLSISDFTRGEKKSAL